MKKKLTWDQKLSRRERQVVEILFSVGESSASEVHRLLPDPPGYSAVRALLRVMEVKGVVSHRSDGPRYLYKPTLGRAKARHSILKQVLDNLFNGSREQLVSALLDPSAGRVSVEELDRLVAKIEEARKSEL